MANALNRNLNVGDKVVMCDGQTVTIDAELFGNLAETMGTAIGVVDSAGRRLRASGMEIDAELTIARHGAENGWS